MKRRYIYVVTICIAILIVLLYFFKISKQIESNDDVIFFKLFSNLNNQNHNNEIKQYNFKLEYDNQKEISKTINLSDTINYNNFYCSSIVNKKIAPGTKGEFEINLESSKNTDYQICFFSHGNKPQNLIFVLEDEEYRKLKNMEDNLKGKLSKGEIKNIKVQWSWEYETNFNNDIQDTKDGKLIKDYSFDISIIANES